MKIRNIKKHGLDNFTYTGEVDGSKVLVVFEDGALPVEGDIDVTLGKLVTKGKLNYYYVRDYVVSGGRL